MSGVGRWLPGGAAGCAGLAFALIAMLLLALVAVKAPGLGPAAASQDWQITLEISNAYMGTLLQEQQNADQPPIELRDPKGEFRSDGTVKITGGLGASAPLPTPVIPIPLPPLPGGGTGIEVPAEIVLRPGTNDGKFTVDFVSAQLGPIPLPDGLVRLLEGPINAQIDNATQNRPYRITGVEVNDGYMLVRVQVEGR
jgi:hypothetical protein